MKIHYLYKITNLINNRFYIGKRTTSKLDDTLYYGSGKALKLAIKKYGLENFIKEILMFFDSEGEAYEAESLVVDEEFLQNPLVYNIHLGGNGGSRKGKHNPNTGRACTPERAKNISIANTGKTFSKKHKENISKAKKGTICSEETREKLKERRKERVGVKSPAFKGYYVTPKGVFPTVEEAAKVNKVGVCSVRKRCLYNNNLVLKPNSRIPPQNVGKTWAELGWGFLEKL